MISKKAIAASAALMFAMPLAASAQQPGETGFYVGGSFGQTKFNDFCNDLRAGGFVGGSCDETDSGWKGFLGYRVNRHLAIEGTYINWGEASIRNATFGGLPTSGRGELTSMGAAIVGLLPVGERFSLFGKVGMLLSEVEVQVNVAGFPGSGTQDETEIHYGFGAMYNVTRNFALRGEWERADDAKATMISIGIQYKF